MLRPAALDGVVCTKVVVAIIEGVAIEHLKIIELALVYTRNMIKRPEDTCLWRATFRVSSDAPGLRMT